MKYCVEKCPRFRRVGPSGGPTGYQCVDSCRDSGYKYYDDDRTCTNTCAAGQYLYRKQSEVLCTKGKVEGYPYKEGEVYVSQCSDAYPYVENGTCTKTCAKFVENNTCVESCESYVAGVPSGSKGTCVSACEFKDDSGQCLGACLPAYKYWEKKEGYTRCTNDLAEYFVLGTQLVKECPVGYKGNTNATCEPLVCYNGQYHQRRRVQVACQKSGDEVTKLNGND